MSSRRLISISKTILLCAFCAAVLVSATSKTPDKKVSTTLPTSKDAIILGIVDADTTADMTAVTIRLSGKPAWEKTDIEDHGAFLQVLLPGVIVPKPGEFYEGAGPVVRKIAAFQVTPNDAAIRIFVKDDAGHAKQGSTAELLNDRLVVTIDHALVGSKKSAPVTSTLNQMAPEETSAEDVVAKTKVNKTIPAPSSLLQSESPASDTPDTTPTRAQTPLEIGVNTIDLRSKLFGVGMFSAVMVIGLMGLYFLKPFLNRRRKFKRDMPVVSMKMLANLPLSPKQKLAVIEIGTDQFVVAISPDSVSFITTLHAHAPQQPEQVRMPYQAAPQALTGKRSFGEYLREGSSSAETMPMRGSSRNSANEDREMSMGSFGSDAEPKEAQISPETTEKLQGVRRKSGRLNLAIGDDGVKQAASQPTRRNPGSSNESFQPGPEKAIKDMTKMIREKLKNIQ